MVNHFSTVGIPVSSEEDFMTYANQVFASGKNKSAKWNVSLIGNGRRNRTLGTAESGRRDDWIESTFSGTAVSTVRLVEKVEDPTDTVLDGRIYSEADPEEDAFAYPFVFDVPDIGIQKIKYPVIREVQVAAFAHELSIYASEEDYHKSQASEPKFASEFFIPSGLFGSEEEATYPSSMAMFGGHVLTTKK
ncbi:hypothetical protein GQR36_13355 [Enterococcus termitis]